jgi:hypothetical protein
MTMTMTANVVPSLLMLSTLVMEVIDSSEESVLTRALQHNIPEENVLDFRPFTKMYQFNAHLEFIACYIRFFTTNFPYFLSYSSSAHY